MIFTFLFYCRMIPPSCTSYPQRHVEDSHGCLERLSQRTPAPVRPPLDHLHHSVQPDIVESTLMASIRQDTQELGTITWSLLARETASDISLSPLLKLIEQGAPSLARDNPSLATLWPICESVYAQEGVLLYQERVTVPCPSAPEYCRTSTQLTKEHQ